MAVWAAGKLLGRKWNWYEFREAFYVKLPMIGREVFTPKTGSTNKDRLAKIVQDLGYTGQLSDYFDVPDQSYKTDYIELTAKQKQRIKELAFEYSDPLVLLGKKHQVENGVLAGDEFKEPEYFGNNKTARIFDYAAEFPKMIIFAKYKAQIHEMYTELSKQYKVLTLTGDTQNRGDVIERANNMKECIFICQAQISTGWELPDCPVMIFASRTYSIVDYIQAQGRILRANALKKNLYINLVVKGDVDEAVDDALRNKKDFNERIYLNL